ncbi:MAG: hypothetical protein R2729_17870 [Bryobacteraceae bacterium]
MDLRKAIDDLIDEKRRLEKAIECLEAMETGRPSGGRRGRKGMDESERREVSARMKRYWAEQRRKKK